MRILLISVALLVIVTMSAKADRPVTDAERAKLMVAVVARGCTGGKMEWVRMIGDLRSRTLCATMAGSTS
jgi:hypothetical protein